MEPQQPDRRFYLVHDKDGEVFYRTFISQEYHNNAVEAELDYLRAQIASVSTGFTQYNPNGTYGHALWQSWPLRNRSKTEQPLCVATRELPRHICRRAPSD